MQTKKTKATLTWLFLSFDDKQTGCIEMSLVVGNQMKGVSLMCISFFQRMSSNQFTAVETSFIVKEERMLYQQKPTSWLVHLESIERSWHQINMCMTVAVTRALPGKEHVANSSNHDTFARSFMSHVTTSQISQLSKFMSLFFNLKSWSNFSKSSEISGLTYFLKLPVPPLEDGQQ